MPETPFAKAIVLAVFTGAVFFLACGSKTEEDRIRELVKEAGQHIEHIDVSALMDLLSDDYVDHRGRDKIQTKDMVQTYFNEFRGIVVHVLGTRIDEMNLTEASIRTDAALSSGAARALRKLVPVSTDNYRFEIALVKKQDRWLIIRAGWKHIGIEELFPESLSLLKKLFPNR
jgi:ketosteroid isomerase-like protein